MTAEGRAHPRPEIAGLTGLRCIAAMLVVLSHSLHSVQGYGEFSGLTRFVANSSALGMTMFFVLSGFVIHYNYERLISSGGVEGFWTFFVARFARLYPLYIVLLGADAFMDGTLFRLLVGDAATTRKVLEAGPYYLTLTQSWFFDIVGQNNLIYQFGRVGSVAWSISTEWFFYLAYPLLLPVVLRLKGQVSRLAFIAALSAFMLGLVWFVVQNVQPLDDYALSRFGPPASISPLFQDSLYRWVLYFAPYTRVSEFLLGVVICAMCLSLGSSGREGTQRGGALLTVAAVAAIAAVHFALFVQVPPFDRLTPFHMLYGYALPVALLIFCLARYRNAITGFLSWKPIVMAGEVSYSLYFLHLLVIAWLARYGLMQVEPGNLLGAWGAALLAAAVALALSFVTYALIEVPARRWFRLVLAGRRAQLEGRGRPFRLAVGGSRAAVLLALVIVPLAILVLRPPPKVLPPPPGTIEIVEATYGASCGAPAGNAISDMVERCSGLRSCAYVVSVYRLGDPASGCSKDFSVAWRCDRGGPLQHAQLPGESGVGGQSVALSCPPAQD